MVETIASVSDPFFRQLYSRLLEEIEKRKDVLTDGRIRVTTNDLTIDPITTTIKYIETVSYIQAFQQVIELGLELDRERFVKEAPLDED